MNNPKNKGVLGATETGIVSGKLRWRLLRNALLLTLFFVALNLVGILLMSMITIDTLHQARRALQAFGEWWIVVRVIFVGGLIAWWVPVNTWLARRNGWNEAHLARVLAGRWLTLAVLVFVELILIQRIHQPFTDWWLK